MSNLITKKVRNGNELHVFVHAEVVNAEDPLQLAEDPEIYGRRVSTNDLKAAVNDGYGSHRYEGGYTYEDCQDPSIIDIQLTTSDDEFDYKGTDEVCWHHHVWTFPDGFPQ